MHRPQWKPRTRIVFVVATTGAVSALLPPSVVMAQFGFGNGVSFGVPSAQWAPTVHAGVAILAAVAVVWAGRSVVAALGLAVQGALELGVAFAPPVVQLLPTTALLLLIPLATAPAAARRMLGGPELHPEGGTGRPRTEAGRVVSAIRAGSGAVALSSIGAFVFMLLLTGMDDTTSRGLWIALAVVVGQMALSVAIGVRTIRAARSKELGILIIATAVLYPLGVVRSSTPLTSLTVAMLALVTATTVHHLLRPAGLADGDPSDHPGDEAALEGEVEDRDGQRDEHPAR